MPGHGKPKSAARVLNLEARSIHRFVHGTGGVKYFICQSVAQTFLSAGSPDFPVRCSPCPQPNTVPPNHSFAALCNIPPVYAYNNFGKVRTIILTYPGFQGLPKGIKQLLLSSEAFYFDENHRAATPRGHESNRAKVAQFNVATGTGKVIECRAAA